jgi:hypothetical protein
MVTRLAQLFAISVAALCVSVALSAQQLPGVGRTFGYVPDAATAIKIAVAVWEPIYGRDHIASERPFHATLHDGVWTVTGSLRKGWVGGVAEADVREKDGMVLQISHGR